jgi:hypothetical protein
MRASPKPAGSFFLFLHRELTNRLTLCKHILLNISVPFSHIVAHLDACSNNARAIAEHKKFLEGKEFGQKSGAPEKMSKIVSNEFAAKWIQTAEQILHAKNSKPRGSLPLPLPTKSSTGLVQATAARKFAPPKKIFVMKRFQNIQGKMTRADMFRDAAPASTTTAATETDAAATQ